MPINRRAQEHAEAFATGAYPLVRKLYFNTVKGFGSGALTTDEHALVQCMSNKAIIDAAINDAGYIPLPGPTLLRKDSNCGAGTGCENNVSPVPTEEAP